MPTYLKIAKYRPQLNGAKVSRKKKKTAGSNKSRHWRIAVPLEEVLVLGGCGSLGARRGSAGYAISRNAV